MDPSTRLESKTRASVPAIVDHTGRPRRLLFGRAGRWPDRTAGLWTISDRIRVRACGTGVASLWSGGDRGVGPVAVHPVLPGAGHHRRSAGAASPAAAQLGRRGARPEGIRRPADLAAQAQPRRARGGPPLPHPVPEGLPAPRAPALQRPQRAPDPGRAAGDRPAQPRPAAGRGAGPALRGEGREVQDAAPGRGRGLPGRCGGQGGHRGVPRHAARSASPPSPRST